MCSLRRRSPPFSQGLRPAWRRSTCRCVCAHSRSAPSTQGHAPAIPAEPTRALAFAPLRPRRCASRVQSSVRALQSIHGHRLPSDDVVVALCARRPTAFVDKPLVAPKYTARYKNTLFYRAALRAEFGAEASASGDGAEAGIDTHGSTANGDGAEGPWPHGSLDSGSAFSYELFELGDVKILVRAKHHARISATSRDSHQEALANGGREDASTYVNAVLKVGGRPLTLDFHAGPSSCLRVDSWSHALRALLPARAGDHGVPSRSRVRGDQRGRLCPLLCAARVPTRSAPCDVSCGRSEWAAVLMVCHHARAAREHRSSYFQPPQLAAEAPHAAREHAPRAAWSSLASQARWCALPCRSLRTPHSTHSRRAVASRACLPAARLPVGVLVRCPGHACAARDADAGDARFSFWNADGSESLADLLEESSRERPTSAHAEQRGFFDLHAAQRAAGVTDYTRVTYQPLKWHLPATAPPQIPNTFTPRAPIPIGEPQPADGATGAGRRAQRGRGGERGRGGARAARGRGGKGGRDGARGGRSRGRGRAQ